MSERRYCGNCAVTRTQDECIIIHKLDKPLYPEWVCKTCNSGPMIDIGNYYDSFDPHKAAEEIKDLEKELESAKFNFEQSIAEFNSVWYTDFTLEDFKR